MVQINNEWMCTAILENQFGGAFCKNIEIVCEIIVIYDGELVGEFDPKQVKVEELGLYMAGAKKQERRS